MVLFNNHYYCYSFNDVIILLHNMIPECKNNDINVRKNCVIHTIVSICVMPQRKMKYLKYLNMARELSQNVSRTI